MSELKRYTYVDGELILLEERDSIITLNPKELRGWTFEEVAKYDNRFYGKCKKVRVYPYLTDKEMMMVTGSWYGIYLMDIKLKLRKWKELLYILLKK